MAFGKKRGAEKSGFDYAPGGRAAKACSGQVTGRDWFDACKEDSMKRRLRVTGLALLAVTTLGSTAVTQEKFQKLTGGQIRTRLGGMELTDNVHWRDLYQRNGTVMSPSMDRKRTGRWRVEQDQLCIELEGEPIPTCYDVWISGKEVELRSEGLLPLRGTLEPASGRN